MVVTVAIFKIIQDLSYSTTLHSSQSPVTCLILSSLKIKSTLLTAACKAPCDLLFSVLISQALGFSHNVWLDTPGQAQEHFPYCSWRALCADHHDSLPHFTHRAFLTKACSRGPLPSSYLLTLLHCSSSTCHHYLSYINRDESSRSR